MVVVLILNLKGRVCQVQGPGCIQHDGKFVRGADADAAFVGAGVRAVGDAGGVQRHAAGADAATGGEVAARIENEFIAVHRTVRIGARDSVGVEIQRAGHETAKKRAPCGEGCVGGGGEVKGADAWLEGQDGEGPRINSTVPPNDVTRHKLEGAIAKGQLAYLDKLLREWLATVESTAVEVSS